MKVLIIEDEPMAARRLSRLLSEDFHDIEIVGTIGSVSSAVDFLSRSTPDIIFMDVRLSDGECFEIFRQVDVSSNVIMTTAFDSYAVKAFEAGSVDYLLKPIDQKALERAVNRCRERSSAMDSAKLLETLKLMMSAEKIVTGGGRRYKTRFVLRVGDMIIPVESSDIAYFISEGKSNSLVSHSGQKYVVDFTLDTLDSELDPEMFFRISRGCIVSRKAVSNILRHINGRLRLSLTPPADEEILVSRSRVDDFLAWLE